MDHIVEAKGLTRKFGDLNAVDHVDFTIPPGAVLGLIGPNGAGKTTLLRALLGLTEYRGELNVLGNSPRTQRSRLMEEVCFIADTAVLPRWMRVEQLLDYASGIHPRFDRSIALSYLKDTDVRLNGRIKNLSKGMMVQVHLALVMAIDARLLILDEPTLGLDILFRKRFFEQLISDYFDQERTIIISTHQVDEVQHILTDVMFLNRGKKILQRSMLEIEEQFVQLNAVGDSAAKAQGIPHLGSQSILGGKAVIYEGIERESLAPLGELRTPSVADLFVAMMGGDK
ncbi:MAG: ABC transporter ATP-binding protein [Halioglobus sp.]|jgi:ABC-2 type transport system ATP-binding protein|uniref:ABC transporter ATP-binding protein n=1 Tax=Candidatus Seongchinamella marina TaxID=2518990 RepID=A0ABT3SQU3_9GAMM|nr:ABC transporter ATP-binding protein [Candidatus Seongchinamella marina]EEB80333.1 ABC transporter, ATP-binding protein [marine gamma proteobacterium HTCC2148]MBT3409723.1 ABC transporter ATP-binding protein [Halieaceae bacterium]MDG1389584.1 ABC transporter ATP-binding protein [Halioglobus sp.]MBT5006749.1 ABC transporter ATP-binding protein [Halieaceae bacterium]MBT6126019.1 ABC transporter ATP-binding protein [Halieaceae bacterium]